MEDQGVSSFFWFFRLRRSRIEGLFHDLRSREIEESPLLRRTPSSKKSPPVFRSIFGPIFGAEDRRWELLRSPERRSKNENSSKMEISSKMKKFSKNLLYLKNPPPPSSKKSSSSKNSHYSIFGFEERRNPYLRSSEPKIGSTHLRSSEPKIGSKIAVGPVARRRSLLVPQMSLSSIDHRALAPYE